MIEQNRWTYSVAGNLWEAGCDRIAYSDWSSTRSHRSRLRRNWKARANCLGPGETPGARGSWTTCRWKSPTKKIGQLQRGREWEQLRVTNFHKGPVLEGLGVQQNATEVAREKEVVLRAYFSLPCHNSLEDPCTIIDSIIAFYWWSSGTIFNLRIADKTLCFDPSHNFIHLGLRKLINQFKMAPKEPPSLADFTNYEEDRLGYLCLDLALLTAESQSDVD